MPAKLLNLRNSNFRYTDSSGEVRIKKEFNWYEFAPKKDGKPLLGKDQVLHALGIDPNMSIEDAPLRKDISGRELKGVWSTFVPGLNYIRVKSLDTNSEDDYFQIEEADGGDNKLKIAESLGDWNKRMWSQPDADKKADKEITKDMSNYGKDRNN